MHVGTGVVVRFLIALVLWAAISVPLALVAGRVLGTRARGMVEEIEAYLQSRLQTRRPRLAGLRRGGAMVTWVALVVGVVLIGSAAVGHLPTTTLLTQRAGNTESGPSSGTATAPPDGARTPASAVTGTHRSRPATSASSSPGPGGFVAPDDESPTADGAADPDDAASDATPAAPAPTTEHSSPAPLDRDEQAASRRQRSDSSSPSDNPYAGGYPDSSPTTTTTTTTTTSTTPPPADTGATASGNPASDGSSGSSPPAGTTTTTTTEPSTTTTTEPAPSTTTTTAPP